MAKNIVSMFLAATALMDNFVFANPAVHIDNFSCGVFDGAGTLVYTTNNQSIATNSGMTKRIGGPSMDVVYF